jgi:F0F1-type ATP synthase gamma subunit
MELNKKILKYFQKAKLRLFEPKFNEQIGLICLGKKRIRFIHKLKDYDISILINVIIDLKNPQYNECTEIYRNNYTNINYDELQKIIPEWDFYDLYFHIELNEMAEQISLEGRKFHSELYDPRIFKIFEDFVSQLLG